MADTGLRRPKITLEEVRREMRSVFSDTGLKRSAEMRGLRHENQARFDASLRTRQRPTRVS